MEHLLIPVITLHLLNVEKKTFYCNDHKITEFEITDKNPLLHILYYINGLTHDFWPLHPINNRSRNKRRNLWVGWCVSSWWPWFPSRSSVLIYMYIYICVHSLYEFCYRSYIQRECHSVLAKLHPIMFYRGVRGSWAECHFLFSLVYQLCLALDINLILGCLWLLVFVLNNILIPHLPGCFCPWTFFENIGFNMVLTDPFMSHLTTQLGYSAGEFQALQLIVLVAFGVVD